MGEGLRELRRRRALRYANVAVLAGSFSDYILIALVLGREHWSFIFFGSCILRFGGLC